MMFPTINAQKINARQDANRKILKSLEDLIERCPDQRFGQIIANYIFPDYQEEDIFFEESVDTLNKLQIPGL